MMKRNILAIVIPALLAGTANAAEIYNKDGNKLDLYGKVDARHFFRKNIASDHGDNSHVHLSIGMMGATQISDQLTSFGRFEWKAKTNTKEDEHKNTNFLANAGLKIADFGSLNYGRNYSVLYDVNAWTDVLPIYGADSMLQEDSYMTEHNLLTYRSTDAFGLIPGLSFALQYQEKNSVDSLKNNSDGFGLSANYNIGWGAALGVGYTKSNYTLPEAQKATGEDSSNSVDGWNAGIKYNANNLYLAAMYGETSNMTKFGGKGSDKDIKQIANKTENVELVAQYLFDDIDLKPSIAYIQSKGKNLPDLPQAAKHQDLTKYISLGAFYYVNKNLTAMVDYKINLVQGNEFTKKYGIGSDNLIGLGLVYQF